MQKKIITFQNQVIFWIESVPTLCHYFIADTERECGGVEECETQSKSWGYISSEVKSTTNIKQSSLALIRQSTMKANTRKFSCSVCASWTRLFTSTHLSTRLQTAVANESRLGAHKFKQVLRKLHACHDNKTNCDDLWRRSQERKETRFLWLDNICVEADLKKERETEKLTLREKKRY